MRTRNLTLAAVLLVVLPFGTTAFAADLSFGERGVVLDFEEPELEVRLGGRFHLDAGFVDDDVRPADDDVEVRRARIYGAFRLADDWRAKVEYEFESQRSGWRSLWGEWKGLYRTAIRVGNQIAPMGLEQQASSNHVVFVERSLAEALSPGFQTGASIRRTGRLELPWGRSAWSLKGGVFVPPMNRAGEDLRKSEHTSLVGRATFAPLSEERRHVHLGASFEYRDVRDGQYRYLVRPESKLLPVMLNTSRLRNVSQATTWGVEAAWVWGPVSMEGQYLRADVARKATADPTFDGFSGQVSWFVTGESRPYSRSRGAFTLIRPERRWGAVELAARFSGLDLNDAGVRGGRAQDLTLAVNWYLLKNARLGFDFIQVDTKGDDPRAFQGRLMVFF
ncbi:MAG: OprO/OprP family phosphate-selective porin [Myxococcota bacterium]